VKIADFGLAKLVGSSRASFTLTGTHQVMGTLDYMAPEQRQRPQDVDHRADVYALGVIFYEMLTSELPLGHFAPPSRVAAVDGRLDAVIFRALEREPEQRYQHASDVRSDVVAITGAAPDPSPRQREDREQVQLLVRGPAAVLLMAAVVAMLFWVGVIVVGIANYLAKQGQGDLFSLWIALPILPGVAVVVLPAACLIVGADRLRRFEGYEWVVVALLLAMLPWSPHWPIGMVGGIWGLFVLNRPEVQAAFAANLRRRQKSARPSALPEVPAEHRPTGSVRRRVRSFLCSLRSMFVSTPEAPLSWAVLSRVDECEEAAR
jgi:hypothetical protein